MKCCGQEILNSSRKCYTCLRIYDKDGKVIRQMTKDPERPSKHPHRYGMTIMHGQHVEETKKVYKKKTYWQEYMLDHGREVDMFLKYNSSVKFKTLKAYIIASRVETLESCDGRWEVYEDYCQHYKELADENRRRIQSETMKRTQRKRKKKYLEWAKAGLLKPETIKRSYKWLQNSI
uniref:Uncharacterized protein n=1 Tax=viral metagenome TaxID=1070528 RepID=A0A6M3M0V1_9ZZZZ